MSEPDIIDIIDFQSEDRSAHQKSETKPVPKSIKLLIGGIALVLVIAAVVLVGMSNKTTSSVNMDGDEEVMAVGGADSDQALGTDELIASLDVTRAVPTREQKLDEQISTMASRIQTMAQQIKALTAQNKTLGQLNTQVSKNTQDLKTTLTQDDLTEIKQDWDNRLQKTQEEIKIASAKPDKKTNIDKKPYKKRTTYRPRLPFKLITIDQWGGDNYAAVESNEKAGIENLRRGDRLSGWKIEQIDAVESSVVFKNVTTGRSVKQTIR